MITQELMNERIGMSGRFQRSVNIERDTLDSDGLQGYILTSQVKRTLRRILEPIAKASSEKAWTITGPYGSGKSAFAALLARYASSHPKQREGLLARLSGTDTNLDSHLDCLPNEQRLLPVLITGRRASLTRCILESLAQALDELSDKGNITDIQRYLADILAKPNQEVDIRLVSTVLVRIAQGLISNGYTGVLIVLDELGKALEYATLHTNTEDVYLLQELADVAARSEKHPIVLVGILHQAFEVYGRGLDPKTRMEWVKIQGRFEDIAFIEPAEQMMRLIAAAIQHNFTLPSTIIEHTNQIVSDIAKLGLCPLGINLDEFRSMCARSYPLHPFTLIALPHLFRRYSQNERSLFSFLSSQEPFGLQDFLSGHSLELDAINYVRLNNIFDYFATNLAHGLYHHGLGKGWIEATNFLESHNDLKPVEIDIIKTIGLLSIVGQRSHLKASEQIIDLAISDSTTNSIALNEGLESLRSRSIITYRQFSHTYQLWAGSDVDIADRLDEARLATRRELSIGQAVQHFLSPRPAVAQRHSYQKGTLRCFGYIFIDMPDFELVPDNAGRSFDGYIICCLARNEADKESFCEWAVNQRLAKRLDILVAVPQETSELTNALLELGALKWIESESNTPELRDDKVAQRELIDRMSEVEVFITGTLGRLMDPRPSPNGGSCRWFYEGKLQDIVTPAGVSELISHACDCLYPLSPILRNELVNRRQLSSAAAKGRRNLIEAMLEKSDQASLGIVGFPPEKSMYECILKASGIHKEMDSGEWAFIAPDFIDSAKLKSSWMAIAEALFTDNLEPIPVNKLFGIINAPPYGLTAGVFPILLCAFMLVHKDETALYREGTFIPEPTVPDWELLMRRNELYEIAGCRVSGERKFLVDRFARSLNVKPAVLPIIRKLAKMVKSLPEHAMKTNELPEQAIRIRETFLKAKSPERLLFEDLPNSVRLAPFSGSDIETNRIDEFAKRINEGLAALASVTDNLIERACSDLLCACGFEKQTNWKVLQSESSQLDRSLLSPHIKPFVDRLGMLSDESTVKESVLAFVGNRPPRSWTDANYDSFIVEAQRIGRLFQDAIIVNRLKLDPLDEGLSVEESKSCVKIVEIVNSNLEEFPPETRRRMLTIALGSLLREFTSNEAGEQNFE